MADTYVVKNGDTLWSIAKEQLGAGSRYQELAKINNIKNPDLIAIGQVLILKKGTSSSSSTTQKASTNKATIKQFGLQSNVENTLFVTWDWDKSNTDNYKFKWYYDSGDGVWFVGDDSSTEYKYSTYTIPSNAKRVRFRVKPVSKTKEQNNKQVYYWTAEWTDGTAETFNITSMSPVVPEAPTVVLKKYRLTASLEQLELDPINTPTHVKFRVIRNKTSVFNVGTAKINKNYDYVSYSCDLEAGNTYQVECKYVRGKLESDDWSKPSSEVTTPPAVPSGGIKKCKAKSATSVYLEWSSVRNATGYEIEYATEKDDFDITSKPQSITVGTVTKWEITGLDSGYEYFFRLRAVNDNSNSDQKHSEWTAIKSTVIGKKPAAPTTWSSTTTAVRGEPVTLYWVHNSEDGSNQTSADIEVYKGNTLLFYEEFEYATDQDDDEEEKTSSYVLDTSPYGEGAHLKWRVRTAGATKAYGEWSVDRNIDIYAPPTFEIRMTDSKDNAIETLTSFPFYIKGTAGPNSQQPISYHLSIISNETYETTDNMGNFKMVTKGEPVYSKYFDTNEQLLVRMSANNVNLDNGVSYTIVGVVSMDSGLTAESSIDFTVSRKDETYLPNAEIGIDEDALTAQIRPYCLDHKLTTHRVTHSSNIYKVSTAVSETTSLDDIYTSTDEEVFLGKTTSGSEIYYCIVYTDSAGNSIDPVRYMVTKNNGVYVKTTTSIKESAVMSVTTETGEEVLLGKISGSEVYYCVVDESALIEDITLSVYRREFDGTFTELATDIDNMANTHITDPHPALDYARYRIVASNNSTGAISYYDVPGYPIGCKAIVIQWDEDWSTFDTTDNGELAEPAWSGSLLKLLYNIDVSDSNDSDVELVKYIGRPHPVTYYGTQIGQTATWNTDIDKKDEETLYALRRLARWMGDVYVREPSGSGYWANISVSFSQKHRELTIPVTLNITRVEGGM